MGGVELSFNARHSIDDIVFSKSTTNIQLIQFYIKQKERFSTSIKGIIYTNFSYIDLYITGGISIKNMKYTETCTNFKSSNAPYDQILYKAAKKKIHIMPIIGCGVKIPITSEWFSRLEYTFEFQTKLSLTPKYHGYTSDFGHSVYLGSKYIKHNIHSIRLGIGKTL